MVTMHLQDPLVIFGYEGYALQLPFFFFQLELLCSVIVLQQGKRTEGFALPLPLFLLSLRIVILFFNNAK